VVRLPGLPPPPKAQPHHDINGSNVVKLISGGKPGEAKTATGRRIAANTAAQIGVRVALAGVSVVNMALLARAFGVADFGVWTAAFAYVGLFSFLTDLGLNQIATQRMASEPERESEWLGALLALRTALSLAALAVCLLAIPLLADTDGLRLVAAVLALNIVVTVPNSLMAVFQSRLRAGVHLSLLVVQGLLWTLTILVLYLVEADIVAFAVGFNVVALAVGALQLFVTRRFAAIAVRRGRALWRELTRVSVPLGIAGVFITIYYKIDSILLIAIAGPEEAGAYGAAYRFLDPLLFIPGAVMASLFPVVAAVYDRDRARVERLVQGALEYLAMISLPVFGGSLVLSGALVAAIFGPEFARAAAVLPLLMAAFVSICLGFLAGYIAPVVGLQWRYALYAGVGVVANVGLNLLLIPRYGAVGSGWATVVTELTTMTLLLVTVLNALHYRPRAGRLVRTAAAAALMTGAVWVAAPAGLVVGLVTGVAAYGIALLALRVIVPAELRRLLAKGQ
jgi:O-antigen/teichoic acid export membrane protein